ncbi:hypothetical protein I7I48_04647 [Histoplasma ohiense]|nr:hypothetical protein I7I48_04647 [Histoplasma ohiense (nom. inval.)]
MTSEDICGFLNFPRGTGSPKAVIDIVEIFSRRGRWANSVSQAMLSHHNVMAQATVEIFSSLNSSLRLPTFM